MWNQLDFRITLHKYQFHLGGFRLFLVTGRMSAIKKQKSKLIEKVTTYHSFLIQHGWQHPLKWCYETVGKDKRTLTLVECHDWTSRI